MMELIPAKPEHAEAIVKNLREHDKFEFNVANVNPVKDILKTLKKSPEAWTAVIDNEVCCMWGIKEESVITGAHMWLITTNLVEQYPYKFLVESKRVTRRAVRTYFMLYGYVDAEYTMSNKWMEWLGFVPNSLVDIGQMKLIRYEMRAG